MLEIVNRCLSYVRDNPEVALVITLIVCIVLVIQSFRMTGYLKNAVMPSRGADFVYRCVTAFDNGIADVYIGMDRSVQYTGLEREMYRSGRARGESLRTVDIPNQPLGISGEVQTRYVNFYPPGDQGRFVHSYRTTSWFERSDADENAKPGRLACVPVTFYIGEGLVEERAVADDQ